MIRISITIIFIFIAFSLSWGQGQITRPKKQEPAKKENIKQNSAKNANNPIEQVLPNSIETVNGITVHWNGVTQTQKNIITELLNNMVFVQGGSFMMGCDDSTTWGNEKPVHREIVSSFWINKYEVTQKLWQTIMGNNNFHFIGDNLPADTRSWDACQSFINKLNRLTGLTFRLPTEAEWEFAARGGNKSTGYKYSGSDVPNIVGWIGENSGNKTHPVGEKQSNELGLYDMTGNVWEWTSDKYSENYNSPRNSSEYVIRGGCCYSNVIYVSVFDRRRERPSQYLTTSGFRLVF